MPLRIIMPLIWLGIILSTSLFSYLYVKKELNMQVRDDMLAHAVRHFEGANANLQSALDYKLSSFALLQTQNAFDFEEKNMLTGYSLRGEPIVQLSRKEHDHTLQSFIQYDFIQSEGLFPKEIQAALCTDKEYLYTHWVSEDVFYLFKSLNDPCEGSIHIMRYDISPEKELHLSRLLSIVVLYTTTLIAAMLVIGGFSYGMIHSRFKRLLEHISGYRHNFDSALDVIEGRDEFSVISKAFYGMSHRLNGVLDDMYTFVAVLDTKGKILFVNNTPLRVSDLNFSQVKGIKLSETYWWAYDEETHFEIDKLIERCIKGEIINEESQIQIAGGRLIWINFSMHPVYDADGDMEYLVAEGVNITEQKEAHESMLRQVRKAQMGDMLSVIAHQWRQPLGVISAVASRVILDTELNLVDTKDLRHSMEKINHTVTHLGTTMQQFTSFFDPNKKEEATSFDRIVHKCVDILGSKIQSEGIKVLIELPHKLQFLSFEEELMQVVMDMMKNSADFFKINSIKDARLILREVIIEDSICLQIEDNAGGIKDEDMDALFEPYFSTKPQEGGTGLGLHMSRMIVEEHCHGKIIVEQLEKGARFTICLPMKTAS